MPDSINISDIVQIGILTINLIALIMIYAQLKEGKRQKQIDVFTQITDEYIKLRKALRIELIKKASEMDLPYENLSRDFSRDQIIQDESDPIFSLSIEVLSFWFREHELYVLGGIASEQWKRWEKSFEVECKEKFWQSVWEAHRDRYVLRERTEFISLMDRVTQTKH